MGYACVNICVGFVEFGVFLFGIFTVKISSFNEVLWRVGVGALLWRLKFLSELISLAAYLSFICFWVKEIVEIFCCNVVQEFVEITKLLMYLSFRLLAKFYITEG